MKGVSVVIPAYNEERYIEKCLVSLRGQSYKDIEIILVDDGSTDKTRDIVKKFKEVTLLKGKHKGPGVSRNLGAKRAKGEILVFVDADMTFDKDYVKNLTSPIFKDKKILGTTHDYEVATNISNQYSKLWGKVRVSKEHAHEVKIFRAIRRKSFLKYGGFDPKYGYADDQTLFYKYGLKPIVAHNTICYHRNPESLRETYKQAIWIGRSWKERFSVFKMPAVNIAALAGVILLTPFKIVLKTVQTSLSEKSISTKEAFVFYVVKFSGYVKGIATAIFFNEVRK